MIWGGGGDIREEINIEEGEKRSEGRWRMQILGGRGENELDVEYQVDVG